MPTKPLTPYCAFVKQHYHTPDILKLPVRDRIKELARRWREQKNKPKQTKKPRGTKKKAIKKDGNA